MINITNCYNVEQQILKLLLFCCFSVIAHSNRRQDCWTLMSLCRAVNVMLWNTVFYRLISMNVWCWASSLLSLTFLFVTSTLLGLLFDRAKLAQAHTLVKKTKKQKQNHRHLVAAYNQAKAQHQCHMGGKKKTTSCLNVFKMLCLSLLLFWSFPCFPAPCPSF